MLTDPETAALARGATLLVRAVERVHDHAEVKRMSKEQGDAE